MVSSLCMALPLVLLAGLLGCSSPRQETKQRNPLVVLMWMPGNAHRLDRRIAKEFTRKTGIPVRFVPVPQSASQQLTQDLALLEYGSSAVDVFQVDTTWPAIVASYMLDLKDALANELSDQQPAFVENATVDGRVIAAPLLMEYGMLYYRTDLLKKYGFSRPPRTWSELETEASRGHVSRPMRMVCT